MFNFNTIKYLVKNIPNFQGKKVTHMSIVKALEGERTYKTIFGAMSTDFLTSNYFLITISPVTPATECLLEVMLIIDLGVKTTAEYMSRKCKCSWVLYFLHYCCTLI